MKLISYLFFVVLFGFTACKSGDSQDSSYDQVGNRKSPISISSIKHEGTYIKVVYGQPYRKGRTIFGNWEPFGEVWRTGANEATEITITRPVLMADNVIEAGTYSLFTIPYENEWTIILNSELGQWGAFEYDDRRDYVRFEVPTISLDKPMEAFTIAFDDVQNSMTTLGLSWDVVKVEIPIRFYGE
ncbi:MAG: DUF2911 domain-containing protein [Balneolaceae bacterium]|nr:DUF2911 domain-containing protein [Balneolaceae bacterium]